MPAGDEYRLKAVELCARANKEPKPDLRNEFQGLAFAYMNLADLADKNALLDPAPKLDSNEGEAA